MSVYYQNGLVYGFKMDPDEIHELEDDDKERFSRIIDEEYQLKESNIGNPVIILDSMNSEFAYTGILQACSKSTRHNRAVFNNNEIRFPDSQQLEKLNDLIEKLDLFNFITNQDPKQYIFTMYY